MIPQSFKDILSNGDNTGLFQTLAMVLFILLFTGLVWYVVSRPKKHYTEQENAPLEDDTTEDNHLNN